MDEIRWYAVIANSIFMGVSLWIAFAKVNRPITWGSFYLNLAAAGINLVAVVMHLWALAFT